MEESILLLFFRIVVLLSITDIQNVQLQTVPDPCPEYISSTTCGDMCTTDYATEEGYNGGTTVDSVTLRVTTQQDGCECEVALQNQTSIYTIYMRKYDLTRSAAPVQEACRLAIDIDHNIPYTIPETKDPIECTNGLNTRSISISKNEVLTLRSRIIGGNFTRGYFMQLFRHDTGVDKQRLQMSCSQPLTTLPMTDATTIYATIPDLRAADEPCPSDIDSNRVVDMCTGDHAFEDSTDGNYVSDSVIVRVMKQKDNCTCRVSLNNNTGSYTVQMRKYPDSLTPEPQNCGLAIDVDYPGTTRNSNQIECTSGIHQVIVLQKNEVIELKTRIIGGSFTRGYCMQIYRKR